MMKDRNTRQSEGIEKFKISKGRGTFNYCTGFGKTYVSKRIINNIREKRTPEDSHVIVIVPTDALKDQWYDVFEEYDCIQVITIQYLILHKCALDCHLLIIDEIHKTPSEQFKQVFELIKYNYILGLTATFDRLDGKESIVNLYCPVIDTITLEEARRNGWVADFVEYNYGLKFNTEEQQVYDNVNDQISKYFAYFNQDYPTLIKCCSYPGAKKFVTDENLLLSDEETGIKLSSYETMQLITKKANICRELIAQRITILEESETKLFAVIEAIQLLKMKTVTFGMSTKVCDELTDRLGNDSRSYHSKITPKSKLKQYLHDFNEGKVQVFNTAKKADLGLDIKGLQCAIIYASTQDPGVHDQRRGRCTRLEGTKESIILNIYIKGTKDFYTLRNRQKNSFRIREIQSLNEIKI